MSNVPSTQASGVAKPSLPSQQAQLSGRIVSRRKINTKNGPQIITIAKLPAPDEFTSPQTVELRSLGSIGAAGEDFSCIVQVGGYGRSDKSVDAETGEQRQVQTADNSLTVVEA